MLLTMNQMLSVAHKNKFAVGSYNVSNNELLRAIIETAEEKKSPAIIQIHPNELDLVGDAFVAYAREAAKKASVPVVIHQDHCGTIEGTLRAIRNGYTSVMIDGSHLSFEENIELTKEAVKIAHSVGVSVEAELGTIGENIGSSEGGAAEILYTDPEQAKEFVERTNCDTLAVAIGTSHGFYPKTLKPEIQLDRLEAINRQVSIPLVLHGGSDNPDEDIRNSTKYGISKINLSSDMKRGFFNQLRETLAKNPDDFEPDVLFPKANEAAKEVLRYKMDLFGSTNKASLYKLGELGSALTK
ncbi:fructose-bisphosphate aldolase [Paraliobacillus ryukyuensis]|uniref:Fructose-bisphosphate aldolase class II n=1 Tax=Paraliobacillus ryukyuensis TaxID=200904 RepID=A0A366EGS4_9BACI|nr:ketose-bisphosphate aldolase [Paraliobacillus ryukyuensis]RBP00629.1 fructose-bisphosphate aldolase class II [Paraliobacillus ryukyuensis]